MRGLFLDIPANFSGPECCFVFVVFAFRIKVSIILKITQCNSVVKEAKLSGLLAKNCATM